VSGAVGFDVINVFVLVVETVVAFFGIGTIGEESSVSERIAAKRIRRIAAQTPERE
jgi:hypothetical protein